MSELKPGDRAVVVGVTQSWGRWGRDTGNGEVAEVIGPGEFITDHDGDHLCYHLCECQGIRGYIAARCLIRLPPDEEAKRLFRETERPREVNA